MDEIDRFYELSAESESLTTPENSQKLKALLEEAIHLIYKNPDLKQYFVKAILSLLHLEKPSSSIFRKFCIYVLKWEEIRQEILSWMNREQDGRIRDYLQTYLFLYDDYPIETAYYDSLKTDSPIYPKPPLWKKARSIVRKVQRYLD